MSASRHPVPSPARRRLHAAWVVLMLCVLGLPWVAMSQNSDSSAEFANEGVEGCLSCHEADDEVPAHEILRTPHAVVSDARTPFSDENQACETCHGPSKAHLTRSADGTRPPVDFNFDESTTAEAQSQVCLGCHTDSHRYNWAGSTHDLEGVSCVGCHDVHKTDDPVLALETQSGVCFECHQEQRAQFLRQSRHPVQASSAAMSHTGLLSCTDCHSPHGGRGPALLTENTINESCWDCHAEKRGPFLWEHAPVREDCTNCHVPHGSNYANLLEARGPWLCQRCHAAGFHPSGAYSGEGVPPLGADQRILGKDCLNCHIQVHGSNHPSGNRLTR